MRKAVRAIVIHNQSILLMKRNKFGDEYYTLPGGGIDPGETAEIALHRELQEETSLTVAKPRMVFIEEAGDPYGTQYIFWCEYQDGDMKLHPGSEEAGINKLGQNLHEPLWVPVSKLSTLPFRSSILQKELLAGLRDGFPHEPKILTSQAEISYTKT